MKNGIIAGLILSVMVLVNASPLDTAYDLLDAITYQDGYALEGIFSTDLLSTIRSASTFHGFVMY